MADWTITTVLSWTRSYFEEHGVDSPRLTSEILLSHSLGLNRLDLYLQYDRPLEQKELTEFKALIKRRVQHEPVAYITGEKGFYDAEFKVRPGVLIPRPDTETLVEESLQVLNGLKQASQKATVLEMGVGSGAIIVTLAGEQPDHSYTATDISDVALATAKENADRLVPGKIQFFKSDWFSDLSTDNLFDLIISNPPYIPTQEINNLEPDIKEFEPIGALDGGEDGLDAYRVIIGQGVDYLCSGGWLLLEIGFDQREGISHIVDSCQGYQSLEFVKDLAGHNRVVRLQKE